LPCRLWLKVSIWLMSLVATWEAALGDTFRYHSEKKQIRL
jgi:hypothetical protein